MKVKVSIELNEDDFRCLALENALSIIKMIRFKFAFQRNRIFKNPRQIPREHEIIFAQLYEKIGYDTKEIDKFKKFRSDYLNEIRKVWANYYAEISYQELNFRFLDEAHQALERFDSMICMVSECKKLIQQYRGKQVAEVPYLLKDAFIHIEYGNEYSLAFHLKGMGVNWFSLDHSPKSKYAGWIVKEFAKVKFRKTKQGKGKVRVKTFAR